MNILGIDTSNSILKGAIVNTKTGELSTEIFNIASSQLADLKSTTNVINKIIKHFNWDGPIGCGFPSVIKNGIVSNSTNLDKRWMGTNINEFLSSETNCPTAVVNDVDAAGIAEMNFGAGKNQNGVVVLTIVEANIGSALFINGKLFPNTKFGQIEVNGKIANEYTSDIMRKKLNLSWEKWAKRFNEYLQQLEFLLWPDLIIIGGSLSKDEEKYSKYIKIKTKFVTTQLQNEAVIIGSALSAKDAINNI
jgi:polyphosphate glucokinase